MAQFPVPPLPDHNVAEFRDEVMIPVWREFWVKLLKSLSGVQQTSGAWTPTFLGDVIAGSPTYTQQGGSWEVTGRLVAVRFICVASALGGMTGNLRVGGLPFVNGGDINDPGQCVINAFGGWTAGIAGYQLLSGGIGPASSVIVINENGSGQFPMHVPVTELTAPLYLAGICAYHT